MLFLEVQLKSNSLQFGVLNVKIRAREVHFSPVFKIFLKGKKIANILALFS